MAVCDSERPALSRTLVGRNPDAGARHWYQYGAFQRGQGAIVALVGVLAGLAAALIGGRLIASLLYGVSPRDPAVFAATAITLLGVVTLACWLPARRAARISPVEALRPA